MYVQQYTKWLKIAGNNKGIDFRLKKHKEKILYSKNIASKVYVILKTTNKELVCILIGETE